jgi:hypothetical protein
MASKSTTKIINGKDATAEVDHKRQEEGVARHLSLALMPELVSRGVSLTLTPLQTQEIAFAMLSIVARKGWRVHQNLIHCHECGLVIETRLAGWEAQAEERLALAEKIKAEAEAARVEWKVREAAK